MNELGQRVQRFWFEPQPTSTLAIFRVCYGLLVLAWAASIAPDTLNLYGTKGIVPRQSGFSYRYGLFDLSNSDLMAIGVMSALIIGAICLVVGYRSRLAAVVVCVMLVSLRDRNGWHMSGGDGLIRILSVYMMLGPIGVALSVDRWRRARDRFWVFPIRSPWPLRLIQVQIAALYLFTTWAKTRGEAWWEGTAWGNVMHVDDLVRFGVPDWLANSVLLSNAFSWGTLAIEASLAILIWNRRWRPYVIVAGIALHLFIEVNMQLGFFSAVMVVSYAAFIPEDTALVWLGRLRRRLARSKNQLLRRVALAEPPASEPSPPSEREPASVPAPAGRS